MQARCDMETDEGGWMVILRRKRNISQQVNFNRKWTEYENGFGDLNTEFWYGLRNIHCLTTRDTVQLQVQLNYSNGTVLTWTYQNFQVCGAEQDYRLIIGQAKGPSGGYNALNYHHGRPFSTVDNDNDGSSGNCAKTNGGGWWYSSCFQSLLTGSHSSKKIIWHVGSRHEHFPHVKMKIRHKGCPSSRPPKQC